MAPQMPEGSDVLVDENWLTRRSPAARRGIRLAPAQATTLYGRNTITRGRGA